MTPKGASDTTEVTEGISPGPPESGAFVVMTSPEKEERKVNLVVTKRDNFKVRQLNGSGSGSRSGCSGPKPVRNYHFTIWG